MPYNPIPYSESAQNIFNPVANPGGFADGFITGDWVEMVDVTSPGDMNATIDGQNEATLVGLVPFNKIRSCERWFLGFAYTQQGDPKNPNSAAGFLKRENPCPHPIKPNLRATSISFKPYIPNPTLFIKANNQLVPSLKLPNPQIPSSAMPQQADTSAYPGSTGSAKTLSYTSYLYSIATVKFTGLRYQFLSDGQVLPASINQGGQQIPTPNGWGGNEYMRNTWSDLSAKTETISADNNSFLAFSETSPAVAGPPLAIPAGPEIGTKFPVPRSELIGMCNYMLKWYSVPYDYLSYDPNGTGIFFPANILTGIGMVNSKPFFGDSPPATILLSAPSFDIKPFCVPSSTGTPLLFCDVTIPFTYFSPENGDVNSNVYGYDLCPYRVNGYWYACQRFNPGVGGVGALNGLPYIRHFDLSTIFNNPNYLPNF